MPAKPWSCSATKRSGISGKFSKRASTAKDLAEQLTRECLRYLYRLLFLFYVEAREELGYAPMKSEEYRTGYSLESLREAAEMELSTEEDRNGFFLHHSLQALFRLIHDGWRARAEAGTGWATTTSAWSRSGATCLIRRARLFLIAFACGIMFFRR